MAPKAFKPVLNEVEESIDAIVLADTPHATISKLHSGTVRTDRKSATEEEIATAKAEKIARRRESNLARGSADMDGSYEEGLQLASEPRHQFQKPEDPNTTRTDH